MERHIQRLWFWKSEKEPWEQYAFNTVQFGDRLATEIISLVVERVAETHKQVASDLKLPQEVVLGDSTKRLWDTYIDDGTTGGSPEDDGTQILPLQVHRDHPIQGL